MTPVDYLMHAETRLETVVRYNPDSSEVSRLQFVRNDIFDKLSESDRTEYDRRKNFVESAEAKAKRLKNEIAKMEANRDNPSI